MDNIKILVVDDDKMIVQSIQEVLELAGYDTAAAYTGKDAIELIKDEDYNIVLCDIMLPDILGTEVLANIQKLKPRIKVIMITGFASLDNAVLSLNLGASAYILKPVNPDNLLKVITNKLHEQDKTERLNEDRVSEWIEDRLNNLEDKE